MKSTASRTFSALHSSSTPSALTPARPDAEEDRVVVTCQPVESQVATQTPAQLYREAADAEQPLDLPLREAVDRLVAGDAVLVEPPRLGARIEQGDVVSLQRQAMCAGQTRRSRSHDGDAPATVGAARS